MLFQPPARHYSDVRLASVAEPLILLASVAEPHEICFVFFFLIVPEDHALGGNCQNILM